MLYSIKKIWGYNIANLKFNKIFWLMKRERLTVKYKGKHIVNIDYNYLHLQKCFVNIHNKSHFNFNSNFKNLKEKKM